MGRVENGTEKKNVLTFAGSLDPVRLPLEIRRRECGL